MALPQIDKKADRSDESASEDAGNTLTRLAVWTRLRELLIEVGGLAPAAVHETASIGADLALESVAFVEITVTLEDEFEVEIDPLEVLERRNLSELVDYILEKTSESGERS